jgi:very-short-patch-repair endonuclease
VIVELDGKRHFGPTGGDYDERRTRYLEEGGIKVIRFENKAIKQDVNAVLGEIRKNLVGKGDRK